MIAALVGAALAAVIAAIAYRAHALSRSGAVAAFAVGTAVFAAGGWPGALVLLAFFVPSTLLSRLGTSANDRSTTSEGRVRATRGKCWPTVE